MCYQISPNFFFFFQITFDRSPNLKRLVVPYTYNSEIGLSEALKMWKDLEELSIGAVYNDNILKTMRILGYYCKNLNTLSISGSSLFGKKYYYFRLDEYNAKKIAKCLVQLKVFSIDNSAMHKDGIRTLLRESKQLVKLNMEHCRSIQYLITSNRQGIRVRKTVFSKDEPISVKLEKKIEGEDVGWRIDSMKTLNASEEVVDHLFGSI